MNQEREIPWLSIFTNWRIKPRSVVYSRYFPYLPGRIAHYLNIDSVQLRKKRVKWILNLLSTYSLEEVDNHFYDYVPQDEVVTNKNDDTHPYDVNWNLYDSLQPVSHSTSEGEE